MTEISDTKKPLPPAVERFVLKWGEMGAHWGVNRSVAQIHALLYLAEEPLTAEEISGTLGLARSNVSNSLKELLGWGLIQRSSQRGDRRDFYEAEADIWEIVTRIAIGRKAREIDPVLAILKSCADDAARDGRTPAAVKERLDDMLDFTSGADRWFTQMLTLPRGKLKMLMKLGARVSKLLPNRKAA